MAEPDDDRFGDDDDEGSRLDPTSPQPAALVEQARLRLLLDAALSIAAELTLDGVLARIVEISCRLTGAEYAALGVLRPDATSGSRALRTFLHHGLAPAQVAGIDHPPTGHGILGVLIDRPAPLRLRDLTAHPDSRGFPPGHPPMRSFLGVPVRIRDRVFGNLYLTEKRGGGEFTQQDEDVVVALAAAAGVAIENAHLYEEAVRREDWLAATAEITGLLSSAGAADHALQEVVDRARVVAGAEVAWLLLGAPERLVVRAVSGTAVGLADLDALTESSLVSDVSTTGRSVSTSDVMRDDPAVAALDAPGWPRIGSAIVVPLRAGSGVVGALALGWTPERADDYHGVDPRMPARYAEQAALALEVMRSRESEQRLALFEDRDRIGRDLHDLVVQRLFAVGLSLKSISTKAEAPLVAERIDAAVDDLDATIQDIRRSIFALTAEETASDIQSEVTRLVERAASALGFRPTLEIHGPVRSLVSEEVAPHLLAVLGEALSNATRHSRAHSIQVQLIAADSLELVVSDDGIGLPDHVLESGLSNIRDRAVLLGGALRVTSSRAGTTLTWAVPTA